MQDTNKERRDESAVAEKESWRRKKCKVYDKNGRRLTKKYKDVRW